MVFHCVYMDLFGCLGLVVICSWWIWASVDGLGRKFLTELNGASLILMEMDFWDIILCIRAMFSIFAILSISMARSKKHWKGQGS